MSDKKKSPLAAKNVRQAGQALDMALVDEALDGVMVPLTLVAFLSVFAVLEWWRHLSNMPPAPLPAIALAVLAVLWAAYKLPRAFARARRIRQGRDGERWVALFLENLRPLDFHVYHDIPLDDSNIDHVLIGPRGVYTIETKTVSKPERGECRITIKNDAVMINGAALKGDPLVQAKAQANWLRNYFRETGFKVPVQPVVLFPGWFVEPFDHARAGVWVLEPKALEGFVEEMPASVSVTDARAMAKILANYVRSHTGDGKMKLD